MLLDLLNNLKSTQICTEHTPSRKCLTCAQLPSSDSKRVQHESDLAKNEAQSRDGGEDQTEVKHHGYKERRKEEIHLKELEWRAQSQNKRLKVKLQRKWKCGQIECVTNDRVLENAITAASQHLEHSATSTQTLSSLSTILDVCGPGPVNLGGELTVRHSALLAVWCSFMLLKALMKATAENRHRWQSTFALILLLCMDAWCPPPHLVFESLDRLALLNLT